MDRVTLENFRCFRNPQSARLAPLTLLVGENSTGKTSFLALIRALWELAHRDVVPDFRKQPYDLGTFAEVAHNGGGRSGQAKSFSAGFEDMGRRTASARNARGHSFQVTFENRSAFPFPAKRGFSNRDTWIEVEVNGQGENLVRFGAGNEQRELPLQPVRPSGVNYLVPLVQVLTSGRRRISRGQGVDLESAAKERLPAMDDFDLLDAVDSLVRDVTYLGIWEMLPFASAPVRSHPRRTYERTMPWQDPEGEYAPAYLAGIASQDEQKWKTLKQALEKFGRESGLFDEISVKSLGGVEGSPFQMQVRKFSGKRKGPQRNLIDVGYGVSQALPVLTELLDPDSPDMFLLQQPEVHLHPSAQAALGSLFCAVAGNDRRQLIVETHSDYLLDRVRMDVRDKKAGLKPEDVSILFFQPGDMDVNIHSLRLDENGNVLDAPDGYGQFFMDEMRRSIGI